MIGYIRIFFQKIAGTDSRRNISLFVLTILGMIIGAAYTLANDGWFGEAKFGQISENTESGAGNGEQPGNEPSVINSFGDDTINVNSSEARDIAIVGER